MTVTTAQLRQDLQLYRRDLATIKHDKERYGELVNRAIREVPRVLWRLDADISLETEFEVRRYSMAAIGGLSRKEQVEGVFIDDTNGHALEIGRWEIEDDDGALTLVLDENPPAADRTITILYARPWAELDFSNPSATTDLDRDWLTARAMTLLLLEADPEIEPPNLIASQLGMWDALRQARELEIRNRPRSCKVRTQAWGARGRGITTGAVGDYLILE